MDVVKGFVANSETGTVTLELHACDCEMRREDAADFLNECIQHELRARRVTPGADHRNVRSGAKD